MKTRYTTLLSILALMLSTTFAYAAIEEGLVAYYPFSGSPYDDSGNGHHGINYGATLTTDRFGTESSSYSFDGIDDYISVPYASQLHPQHFTISAWIKSNNGDSSATVVSTDPDSLGCDHGYRLHVNEMKATAWIDQSSNCQDSVRITADDILAKDLWHHVVSVYDGTLMLYINGILQSETATFNRSVTTAPLQIGASLSRDGIIRVFNGSIDDIRVYDRPFSSAEAEELYLSESVLNIGNLESPSADEIMSGIGLIRGWHCDAEDITISIDDGNQIPAVYGNLRRDTETICGDINNGFETLWNWSLLGDGLHTIKVYADGVMFGEATFSVVTLGFDETYVRNLNGEFLLENFPVEGETTTIGWSERTQNFVITGTTHSTEGE